MSLVEPAITELPDVHIARIDETLASVERDSGVGWRHGWALATAARQAADAGEEPLSRSLGFAAELFSIELAPAVKPRTSSVATRSPFELDEQELTIVRRLVDELHDPDGRARAAHLLWIRKRDHKMAELAVDEYLRAGREVESPDSWPACRDRYAAALHLAASFAKGREPYEKVITQIREAITRHAATDTLFLTRELMELLLQQGRADVPVFSEMARQNAERAEVRGNYHLACEYRFFRVELERSRDAASARGAEVEVGETYERQARSCAETGEFNAALHHLYCAVHYLTKHGSHAEQVSGLRRLMAEYGPKARAELEPNHVSFDASDMVEAAKNAMVGKKWQEALFSLAMIVRPTRVALLRQTAIRNATMYPMQHLFGLAVMNDDGRVVGRRDGIDPSDPEKNEEALIGAMVQEVAVHRTVAFQGYVSPARYYFLLEHSLSAGDLLPYLHASPFVPPGREQLFARGLFAGFDGDFLIASHLLIPQIENSIRYVLLQRGDVNPVKLKPDGIDEQKTFGALLALPETVGTFGEDLVFDLRAVLDHRLGPNLRNGLAHGLLPPIAFEALDAAYVWWLVLHLCLKPLILRAERSPAPAAGGSEV